MHVIFSSSDGYYFALFAADNTSEIAVKFFSELVLDNIFAVFCRKDEIANS